MKAGTPTVGARGFTLIELLVSMAIFAVIGVMAYGGMQGMLRASAHIEPQYEELRALQTAFRVLSTDLEQIVSRSVRDELGDLEPAVEGGTDAALLKLTRYAPTADFLERKVELRRIEYAVVENSLVRYVWPSLDRVQADTPLEQYVLHGVASASLRFFGNGWIGYWPEDENQLLSGVLPRAMEFTLELVDGRSITRVILMASST